MIKVTVYSIEGGIATIELENGKLQNIIKALLPYGAKVGDTIDIESGLVEECPYFPSDEYESR